MKFVLFQVKDYIKDFSIYHNWFNFITESTLQVVKLIIFKSKLSDYLYNIILPFLLAIL